MNSNYKFSSILWISHFFTDSIAAYALTIITIKSLNINNFIIDNYIWLQVIWYFVLYNFLAFFWQIFLWFFLDKVQINKDNYNISIKLIIISFIFYFLWVFFLNLSYFFSIVFIWIWSCLFHLWSWNISLLSNTNKATNLWIFASWWVVWLSFWWFIAVLYPYFIFIILIFLIILSRFILLNNDYKIDNDKEKEYYKIPEKMKTYIPFIILFLLFILIIRSAIWTNFQIDFSMDRLMIFYLAVIAFLWKIIGWILEDNKNFKETYFIFIWIISFLLIYIYSFYYNNIILLLIWIFLIQIFVSPITIIIYKIILKNRGMIVWFTFGMSLILWYLIL